MRHKWDSTLGRFVPLTKEELLIQEHYNTRRSSEAQANAGCGSGLGVTIFLLAMFVMFVMFYGEAFMDDYGILVILVVFGIAASWPILLVIGIAVLIWGVTK